MRKILTISELTRDIKEVLENVFEDCLVGGEVSNLRQPSSGHIYLSLKDEACSIRCVIFRMAASRLKFQLQDGMRVIAAGRVGVYEKDGQYQLYINELEPQGRGALQLAFEQLKGRLAAEGLFDEAHKKPLPFLPRAIGVVTSPTGAVIRDILNVLDRRFKAAHVIVSPVRVQGESAAQEIAQAIADFNELKNVDVVIVARGGGSLEDLRAFNEEIVARSIYASEIPVISAVGHETDTTIADFVADFRAPTPSAAAEIVMPDRKDLQEKIAGYLGQLHRALADFVPQLSQRLDDASDDLIRAMTQKMKNSEVGLEALMGELAALNPLAILRRGYSLTTLASGGAIVTRAADVKAGVHLRTRLAEGELLSEVLEIKV